MASLPSVVLGFLAALVIAPFVDHWLAAVLASFLTIPLAFVVAGYLWQLLPEKIDLLLSRYRFPFILAVFVPGLAAATVVGPLLEKLLFRGDIKTWVNGGGSATPGWMIILLPLTLLMTTIILGQFVNPWLRRQVRNLSRFQHAIIDFTKFLCAALWMVGLAWLLGMLLSALGLDPRGTLIGTYIQRNALVVGFMMAFAIIPIIFTIAEDALSAVPEHLRSASLGCGATPWQTATFIIIPTAMSGLFSAVMIGLGRRGRRNDDRPDGRRQRAGHGSEPLQRFPHAVGQYRRGTTRGGPEQHAFPRPILVGRRAICDDVCTQYRCRNRAAALPQEGVPAMSTSTAAPQPPLAKTATAPSQRGRYRSSLLAHGRPTVWLHGGALAVCLLMIAGLLILVFAQGLSTFWPGPVIEFKTFQGRNLYG